MSFYLDDIQFWYRMRNHNTSYCLFITVHPKQKWNTKAVDKVFNKLKRQYKMVMFKDIGINGLHIHIACNRPSLIGYCKRFGEVSYSYGKYNLHSIIKYAMKKAPKRYDGEMYQLWDKLDIRTIGCRWYRNNYKINYSLEVSDVSKIQYLKMDYKCFVKVKLKHCFDTKLMEQLCCAIENVICHNKSVFALMYHKKICVIELYCNFEWPIYIAYLVERVLKHKALQYEVTHETLEQKVSAKYYMYKRYLYLRHMQYQIAVRSFDVQCKPKGLRAVRRFLNVGGNTLHYKMFEAKGPYIIAPEAVVPKLRLANARFMLVSENGTVRGYCDKPRVAGAFSYEKLSKEAMHHKIWLDLINDAPKTRYFSSKSKNVR